MKASHYGLFERRMAIILDSFPGIKKRVKRFYQLLNYYLSSDKSSVQLNPKVSLITLDEPKEHFFGYYDKSCWSPDGKYLLYHRVVSPEKVEIIVYDLEQQKTKILGHTLSWNWQQGAMTQWMPGSSDSVIFNAVENDQLISKIVSIKDVSKVKKLPMPVQALSPNGKFMISLNYRRLANLRPDYGYFQEVKNFKPDMEEQEDGLWRVDLETGETKLIISLADLKKLKPQESMVNAEHKVNHVLFSPDGNRFVFMHRWIGSFGKSSRLYSAKPDGSNLCILSDDSMVSHYSWKDSKHLLAWSRKKGLGDHYFLFRDQSSDFEIVGQGILDTNGDGHPSFSPDRRWVLTDTYPGRNGKQSLFLFDTQNEKIHLIAQLFSPWKFTGTYRCDLHPRWSPDGRFIAVDSVHTGRRGLFIVDVSKIALVV